MKKHLAFRSSNGGIRYIGYDWSTHQYSTSYYANIGLLNCSEVEWVKLKVIRDLTKQFKTNSSWTEVNYLK